MSGQLDSYSMLIVMKYLKTERDLTNAVMTNSKFEDNLEKFHFNPVPVSKRTLELFPNLETVYYYSPKEVDILPFKNNKVHWYLVSYSYCSKNVGNNKYKYLIFNKQDITDGFIKDGVIAIPEGVVDLGNDIFESLQINSAVIPKTVVNISRLTFRGCRLKEILLPNFLSSFHPYCFSYCSELSSINLPITLTSIPNNCFSNCSLTHIHIPSSVKYIGDYAFYNNKLKSVTMDDGITRIGLCAFCGCPLLESIKLPTTLQIIERNSFYGCGLFNLVIPSSVTSIGEDCFRYNWQLSQISITTNTKSIGYGAFSGCVSLQINPTQR